MTFLLVSIVVVSILFMLLRPRGIAEVWWVGSGALLLVLCRIISLRDAGRAIAKGADVYLFLIGMMLLCEVARENGLFDWLSSRAVELAGGSSSRLFALVYGAGTIVTICMSNDATAVVLTPAILSVVRRARVKPLPFLFACAMIANAASFVLPISNPANLVVFRGAMPTLGQWLAAFTLPSLCSIAATYLVLRTCFGKDLRGEVDEHMEPVHLTSAGKLVLIGLIAMVTILLASSALGIDLGLPTCVTAIVIAGVVCARQRSSPAPMLREISWSTLLLVAALFVMVEAVQNAGGLAYTSAALRWARALSAHTAVLLVGFVVGIANNLVNNLPLGLLAGATVQQENVRGVLAHAVLIGVDLGPNLSVTGSLATILWLIALRREKVHVSAWDFFKIGALVMPAGLLAALGALLAVHALRFA